MCSTRQEDHRKICNDMTQIQIELEGVLQQILERAGNKIKPLKQEEARKRIEGTKQLLELFKLRYSEEVDCNSSLLEQSCEPLSFHPKSPEYDPLEFDRFGNKNLRCGNSSWAMRINS